MNKKARRTAERQHGLITREQAGRAGLTRDEINGLLRSGDLVREAKCVFRISGAPRTWRQRVLAAVLVAGPGAVAAGRTAAALWGFPGFPEGPIEITRPVGRSRVAHVGILHETFFLPDHHVKVVDGIPVTSVERSLFDICGVHRGRQLPKARNAVRHAITRRLSSVARLRIVLAETGAPRRPGTAGLRAILGLIDDGQPVSESELEDLLLAVVRRAGLPLPVRQLGVGGTSASIGRVDFVYMQARLVIEADSRRHHSSWFEIEEDRRRDALLMAAGWHVLRVTWRQLTERPDEVLNAIRAQLAAAVA